ncbi:tetratricopeptide repeat protein [Cupriavidus sp. TMH.W2]|uniref:tetratricopeptide repeat protein n=1 Tax=Cupriavidus sp. TMH.W2 TaxID=3434465 RepID=UPI003D77BC2C
MRAYTMRDVMEIVGMPRTAVMSLVAAGVVAPTRGDRGEYRFSFRDLVVLRTAQALRQSNISAGRIRRSLLRSQSLAHGRPTSAMSLRAEGNDVIARAHGAEWVADSGQMRLALGDPAADDGVVSPLQASAKDAYDAYEAARQHEAHQRVAEAESAYRNAIRLDPSLHAAWLDLSALLCDQGHCAEALQVLADARAQFPSSTALLFNLGLALEDSGDDDAAMQSYHDCLALDPQNADAHFNLGRLYDLAGRSQQALRHYSRYRVLTR